MVSGNGDRMKTVRVTNDIVNNELPECSQTEEHCHVVILPDDNDGSLAMIVTTGIESSVWISEGNPDITGSGICIDDGSDSCVYMDCTEQDALKTFLEEFHIVKD